MVFSDSSEEAYGTCAYFRWEVEYGVYHSNLLMATNRIAPKPSINIPRLELCAAVIVTRMRRKIEELMDYEFIEVYHLTDTRIVRDQIKCESYRFQTFTAVLEWFWIPSEYNPANLITRADKIVTPEDEFFWKYGTKFLSQSFDLWPIEINDEGNTKTGVIEFEKANTMMPSPVDEVKADIGVITMDQFNHFKKMMFTTCIMLEIVSKRTSKINVDNISAFS